LKAVDGILARGELQDYYLLHAVRDDLFRRLGDTSEARSSYEKALSFTRLEPARRFLQKRLNELSNAG
jgi:RNA polymerase sigma-70 factor (ECF subfamily)